MSDVVDQAGSPVAAGSLQRLVDLKAQCVERTVELADINATDIATVIDWASANGVPHATLPIN